jgi:GNAT superfamily N-acetyltransferase
MPVSENSRAAENHLAVRRAEARDFAAVTALLTELGRPALTPESAAGVEAVYRRHLEGSGTGSLVAEVDGVAIGFLSLVFREHLNFAQPQAWIPDLIVTESARGLGAARALLDAAFVAVEVAGCEFVRLESGYGRSVAHRVYEAVGMSNDGYYLRNGWGDAFAKNTGGFCADGGLPGAGVGTNKPAAGAG